MHHATSPHAWQLVPHFLSALRCAVPCKCREYAARQDEQHRLVGHVSGAGPGGEHGGEAAGAAGEGGPQRMGMGMAMAMASSITPTRHSSSTR